MTDFATITLPAAPTVLAPDGSQVRVLLALSGGSMAHFLLPPGQIARAVRHRSVDEIWFVLGGNGAMWRAQDGSSETVELGAGVCLTIPAGTLFQFRAFPGEALEILGVTMPPWPGEAEAEFVAGVWEPTV
jgi:mannose-6-phosphate isomerase-like protein (cupin superfamily)